MAKKTRDSKVMLTDAQLNEWQAQVKKIVVDIQKRQRVNGLEEEFIISFDSPMDKIVDVLLILFSEQLELVTVSDKAFAKCVVC